MKYLTFSFDDGVLQDQRMIALLDRFGLKATFNLNSALLGQSGTLRNQNGACADHTKLPASEVRAVYQNHEVAVHTLTHPNLTQLPAAEVIRQVEEDRLRLSDLVGYDVIGMAYPCGGVNHDARTADIVRQHTGVQYARTIVGTESFAVPEDPFRWHPTTRHLCSRETMSALIDAFLSYKGEETKLFYIWGHSYECDFDDTWAYFEDVCRRLSGHDDVFYGTNSEVLQHIGGLQHD